VTELLHDGTDDGFHEIQLSGKQLVFLFMATTVVSVVIFLCGVLVGRGVKGETVNADPLAARAAPQATGAQSAPSPTELPPPPAEVPLRYPKLLAEDKPAAEDFKPVPEPKVAPETARPVPAAAPVPGETARPPAAGSETPRAGVWAVQVVALTDRTAANAVVQRLNGKGYPAFLVSPQAGAPVQNYKVRVGRYGDRAEAEQVRNRLKKEEQFEPWILR
jgi:cell division septation protein DedD